MASRLGDGVEKGEFSCGWIGSGERLVWDGRVGECGREELGWGGMG